MHRVLFEKTGTAIWMSHLDLMRLMQRTFRRAGVLLHHSQGYTPHAYVSMLLPLFIPIAQAVGIDLLHLGMIVTMTNVMGCMTPPVANNIFAASTFTGLPMGRISKGELPYLGCFFVVLLIVVFCPGLITMFG